MPDDRIEDQSATTDWLGTADRLGIGLVAGRGRIIEQGRVAGHGRMVGHSRVAEHDRLVGHGDQWPWPSVWAAERAGHGRMTGWLAEEPPGHARMVVCSRQKGPAGHSSFPSALRLFYK